MVQQRHSLGKIELTPSSIILSGEMMLRHMGWDEAADFVLKGVKGAIQKNNLHSTWLEQEQGKSLSGLSLKKSIPLRKLNKSL